MKTPFNRSIRKFFGQPSVLSGLICAVLAFAPAAWAQSSSATGTYTVTTNGSVITYIFTGSGTFTPSAALTANLLVVAGGGGGGGAYGTTAFANEGGGGGGGGVVSNSATLASGTQYTVTVGAGGTAGTSTTSGGNGGNSIFGSYTATGGGGGGSATSTTGLAGGTGGSGGGGGRGNGVSGALGSGTSGQGNNGAAGASGLSGGGGGAGAAGTSYNAGNGIASTITGTSAYYAGGGAGGFNGTTQPTAGLGGGGAGGYKPASGAITNGSPGTANTGGGGGGAYNNSKAVSVTGGSGGSGIVIISYVDPASAGNSTVSADTTIVPADGSSTATITVTLKDSSGYPLPGKTVTLASSRGSADTISAASGASSALGVVTFTVKSSTGGSAIFTATDTTDSITVTQTATISFTTGVTIDHFTVTPSVSSATAGQVFTVTVQAYTTGGAITGSSADGIAVALTSSGAAQFDANGDGTYGDNLKPLTNGTFTINVSDLKAETITLTATTGTATGTSSSVGITPGAVAQLQLLLPGETATPGFSPGKTGTPTTRTAGIGFSVTVNAVDTNWNIVATSDTVSLSASNAPNAILPANTALSSGTATLNLTNILAGSGRTLTATDVSNGSIASSTSPAYNVIPGAVARMLLLAPGESATFGVAPGKSGSPGAQNATVGYSVTVDALDAYYNLATNATDIAGITSSAAGDTLPANAALIGGTKTFSLTNNTVGSVMLTATNATQGAAVATGTSTVPVSINATTTALASSANPAYEGQSVTFTATVSGAGLKTGTVTFKNGSSVLGTSSLSGATAALTISGGAATNSITATYNGDGNNSASTSSALSQVIQTGEVVVGLAQMQDGFDYNLVSSMPIGNPVPGLGVWQCSSDSSLNANTSANALIKSNDLASTTSPSLKPLPNQTTNVAAHLYMNKGATDREMLRSIGNSINGGSAYFSFLLSASVNPTTSGAPMATMLASNANNAPFGNDPITLYGRVGADSTHYNLGIQRLGGTISWASASLADNTNYTVVLEYTFGGTCQLFINPVPGNSQPVADAIATGGTNAEPANIGTILFYESGTPLPLSDGQFNYDVMRVDSNWSNVTPPINAVPAGATKLAFSPAPQTFTVNSNSTLITVALQDQNNNTFAATSDTIVSLSSSSVGGTFLSGADGTTAITSLTISNGTGTATFYYKDSIAGNPTISGSSGLLTPAAQAETVNPPPGLLDHFTVTPSLSSTTAGAVFTATVQAYDSNNVAIVDSSLDGLNVIMTSSGLAQFDANGDGTYGDNSKSLHGGTLTINVRDLKAESVALTATLGTQTGTSSSISVGAGAAAQLQLLMPGETATPGAAPGKTGSPAPRTAGLGYSVTVNAVDTNWNVTASGDTVQITAANDANALLPAGTSLSGGTVTLSVTNIIAGSGRTLTASDTSNGAIISATSSSYSVVAGSAARLIVLAPGETAIYGAAPGKTGTPSHQLQGVAYNITVTAVDAYYNFATSASDTVGLGSSDALAVLPANAPLVAGTKTLSITHNTAGTVTDTATDISAGGVAAGSSIVQIDPVPKYQAVQSGNWEDTNTWQYSYDGINWLPATSPPSSLTADTITISNGYAVTINANVTIDQTTVAAGSKLLVASSATVTVNEGLGTDLDVSGTLVNAGTIATNLSPLIVFESGGKYQHNFTATAGTIPLATWNVGSTCEFIGYTTQTTAPGNLRQAFYNLTWNCTNQTADLSFAAALKTVYGNFTMVSTGPSGRLLLGKSSIASTDTLFIGGNLNVQGGILVGVLTSGGPITTTLAGDLLVTGGTFDLADQAAALFVLNVSNNVSVTGGTLTSTNTGAINFVKAGTQNFVSGGNIAGSTAWTVGSGSTLNLGTNVLNGSGTFALNAGGGLITAQAGGLKGNIAIPSTNVTLSTSGSYTYNGVVGQSGDSLLPAAVASLTVNNNQGLILNQAETVTNLYLNNSTMAGNISMGSPGAFTVTGNNSTFVGNMTMNSSSLVLVSSNSLPELTVQGGALNLNAGGIVLTILGSALPQGNYLLVDANSGGSVSGTPPPLATVNGSGLLAGLTGSPQIVGGKLYLSVVAFFAGYDSGPGFFGGENLIFTNVTGGAYYVWSSTDPSASVSNWTLEGQMSELPLGTSGFSRYGININPTASPTYYVLGTTNGGPYLISPVPVMTVTTEDYSDFTVVGSNVAINAAGVLNLVPAQIVSSGHALVGGAFQLQFSGGSLGQGYSILASTNLTSWTVISTGTIGSSPVTFTDTGATNYPARFYRISLP